jgi:protein TonB
MHCALAVAFYAAGRRQPQARHDWIEVRLVESCGMVEGNGSGPSSAQTQTGDSNPKRGELDFCPPPGHELLPSDSPRNDQVGDKPPEHAHARIKTHPVVPVRKRAAEKNPGKEDTLSFREEPAAKPENNVAATTVSAGVSTAPGGPGAGAPSAAGSTAGGEAAGTGLRGGGGDGMEVAFGSPSGPRFLRKVVPVYPAFARKQEMQGAVLLRVSIDEQGRVLDVEVVRKAGFGFDEAAVKAVRESTFIPAKRDGRSCSCKALLPIRFELKSSATD